jgi:hypothetical protein
MGKLKMFAFAVVTAFSFAGAAQAVPIAGAGSLATVIDATALNQGVSEAITQVQWRHHRRHYRPYRAYRSYNYSYRPYRYHRRHYGWRQPYHHRRGIAIYR